MSSPLNCLTEEQQQYLEQKVHEWYEAMNSSTPNSLVEAGFLFPEKPPSIWETLPDEWEDLMEQGGIYTLSDNYLEDYLEKWNRLLGYAYWVQGLWQDRVTVLERCRDFVKDFIFAHADGGREQKAAVAGSHWITVDILSKLTEAERKLIELSGLIRKWEETRFSISRTITNRQGKPAR